MEGVGLALAYSASLAFHLSQVLGRGIWLPTERWRYVDNFFALAVASILVFHLLPVRSEIWKRGLQVSSLALIFLFAAHLIKFWMRASVGLILTLAVAATLAREKSLDSLYDRRRALAGGVILILAILISAGPRLFGAESYALFHGSWHVMSTGAIYILLRAKR
ncbi:MAG: DUF3522 domain-containing protein [Deltaproteobacteria bacterium]